MSFRGKAGIAAAVGTVAFAAVIILGGFEFNEAANWQHVQYPTGKIIVRDKAGWYPTWFGKVTTYPREGEIFFGEIVDPETGEVSSRPVVRTSFSDNGEGLCSGYLRFSTPTGEDDRKEFHKKYRSIEGIQTVIFNYATKTMKVTGPSMTASEHKQAKKAEFLAMLEDQTNRGTYEYTQVSLEDPSGTMQDVEYVVDGIVQLDEEGDPIMRREPVMITTNVVIADDNGVPQRSSPPPYSAFGVYVTQFDITKTEYDTQSNELFAARQNALLRAQQFKADQDAARQEAEKVRQEKLMELAEVTGNANKEKEMAVIAADREREIATIAAKQKADVAKELEQEAINLAEKARVEAQMRLDVATQDLLTAQKEAEAIERLAAAEEERIQRAGAITEETRILAELALERDVGVAAQLKDIRVPGIVMGGGGTAEGGGETLTASMFNLAILEGMGITNVTDITALGKKRTQGN